MQTISNLPLSKRARYYQSNMDLDCLEVQVDERRLYVPVGTILLTSGNTYRFHLVSHIITEVEA